MENKQIPLRLWYKKEAPHDNEGSPAATWRGGEDKGWERWSLPVGNGYFGANVFGRTETERIQITEKTLMNPPTLLKDNVTYFVGGLNSFSETYIDFAHSPSEVGEYKRYLDLSDATAGVEYLFRGVRYTREYFTSYPDKALVIRLDSDTDGALDFTLRPTIPYLQSYGGFEGDGVSKEGSVISYVDGGIGNVELSGNLSFFGIDYLGIFRVYTDSGSISAAQTERTYNDSDGTPITVSDGVIKVKGARSAFIVATLGTDYELSSEVFTSDDGEKPTHKTTLDDTRAKISGYMEAIEKKIENKSFEEAYAILRGSHVADHSALFGRVSLDLGCDQSDYEIPTDLLLEKYKSGYKSAYLETLLFQYGRYLLIASSREGALPATLQGVWNTYNVPPWSCDYTHNINVQMNYWPAFPTNLAETFSAYAGYNAAYMKKAEEYADSVIRKHNPEAYGKDGGNGWVIGAHVNQLSLAGDRSAGNLGFTTQLFWEYYSFTKDPSVLERTFRVLVNAARYITKCTEPDGEGNYLVSYCDSPEVYVDGVWYYTKGTTYAQTFAYVNNYNALLAARELGINLDDRELLSCEEYSVLATVMGEIDKYSPIHVGLSGQLKEFREEDFYSSVGEEYHHRHVSQIVGLYPCSIVNSNTPAWLDAAKVSLTERGDDATGWGLAHRMCAWARTKNGDRTYKVLNTLLSTLTATNLWNICPPFQIDGNFGSAAGIAEMLLQSHEGYIAPLAALPAEWKNGSFSGLVARGGFEVSSSWQNGVATELCVTSARGGEARIFYPMISTAYVSASGGKPVGIKVISDDLISFDTVSGESYTVSGFIVSSAPEMPKNFKQIELDNKVFELSWDAVEGAASYNVYIAEEDAAEYKLIGSTNETRFTHSHGRDERITFALTAVGGREGERALCYALPSRTTPHGVIPGSFVAIPFALFASRSGKTSYVGSFNSIREAVCEANRLSDVDRELTGAVIYTVRNHIVTADEALGRQTPRLREIVIDLGGRALTLEAPLADFSANANSPLPHSVKITGGTLLTNESPIFLLGARESIKLTFSDVRIARKKNPSGIAPLLVCGGRGSAESRAEVSFEGCRVDFNTEPSRVELLNADGADCRCTISFIGGNILVKSLEKFVILSESARKQARLEFIPDESGKTTLFGLTEASANEVSLPEYVRAGKLVRIGQRKVHFTRITEYELS